MVNKNLSYDFSTVNTNGPTNVFSRYSNNGRNHEKFFLRINECSNTFESVMTRKLQNPENNIIGHLNVDS